MGRRTQWHDKIIQWVTHSPWNHAGLIVDSSGMVIEMYQGGGIKKSRIDKEKEDQILIVRIPLSPGARKAIKQYALAMYEQKIQFGYVSLLSLALNKLLRSPLVFKINGTQVCSEFVANALARGGVIWEKDTVFIAPADLYDRFVEKKTNKEL